MMFYANHTKCMTKIIKDLYTGGGIRFAIYPFGEQGKICKSILNVYFGIQEHLIIDNVLAKEYERIKILDELSDSDLKDVIVLITSDREDIYDELREQLYQKVPCNQCVELFPRPVGVPQAPLLSKVTNDMAFHLMHLASMQTAEYITKNLPTAPMFANRYELLEHIFLDELINVEGMYLEFGVRGGTSINFIAAYNPTKTIYGFDSFEGLPEAWNFYAQAGAFDLGGLMPKVNSNVQLIKGWFDKTLPDFLKDHSEKCAFVHIDSDIYSSAKTVFTELGKKITHGTVIQFDEYFDRPNWQKGEFKAFHEFLDEQNLDYEYIGYCNNGPQCAVRIK